MILSRFKNNSTEKPDNVKNIFQRKYTAPLFAHLHDINTIQHGK